MISNKKIRYQNAVQKAIFIGSREEAGLWEVLIDIADEMHIDKIEAFELLKEEIDYLIAQEDIYLIRSEELTGTEKAQMINKKELLNLTLNDAEFNENGPFYFLFDSLIKKNS